MLAGHPKCFQQMMLDRRIACIKRSHPLIDSRQNFLGIAPTQLEPCAVVGSRSGLFQLVKQLRNRQRCQIDHFVQRTIAAGDAVDAAMNFVAIGISQIVLHVADNRVLPVDEVDRAVRPGLAVHRAEVRVGAGQNRLLLLAGAAVIVANIIVDILYAYIDPRVRVA